MQKLFLALILLILGNLAEAGELKIKRRFEHNWKTPHWLTFHHINRAKRSHIVALNQKNLEIEILDASSGQTLLQDRLDSKAKLPQLIEVLSARSGEFLVALARKDQVVEVHSIDDPVSFEVPADTSPTQLSLFETSPGQVFLSVTTPTQISIFHREDSEMRLIQKINWKTGIQKTEIFHSQQAQILIELYDQQGKLHLLELDPESRRIRERLRLNRPSFQVAGFLNHADDYFVAFKSEESAHLQALGQSSEIAQIPLAADLGNSGWLAGLGHQQWFLALQRDNGAPSLAIYDAYAPRVPLRLSPGSASQISHTGVFSVHGQTYYHYVKDSKTLHMQNAQELSAITTRRDEQIADVKITRDANSKTSRLLVVRLDSETGSRLQVLELN